MVHSVWCIVYGALGMVHWVLCIVCGVLCMVHCALCMVHCVWCIVYGALCIVYGALCMVHCVWCIVYAMVHCIMMYCVWCIVYGVYASSPETIIYLLLSNTKRVHLHLLHGCKKQAIASTQPVALVLLKQKQIESLPGVIESTHILIYSGRQIRIKR